MKAKPSSNGLNADGSLMNCGNRLGDRPCIKLYPQYSSGATMKAMLQGEDIPQQKQPAHPRKKAPQPCSGPARTLDLPGKSTPTKTFQQEAFLEACKEGRLKVVKHSVTKDGADVTKGDAKDAGWTGLHYSASGGHLSVVRYLLSLPAAAEVAAKRNVYGETAEDVAQSAVIRQELRKFMHSLASGNDRDPGPHAAIDKL